MSRSPTFSETYNSLFKVCEIAQKGLFDLGLCREKYAEEELTTLVLKVSKAILDRLPCLQLECDAIEHEDSRYGAILARIERGEKLPSGFCDECDEPCGLKNATETEDSDPDALQCQDQAEAGKCDECQHQPCDLREEGQ